MAGRPKYDRGEYKRNLNLKVRYGITIEEFNELLDTQNGTCAICPTKTNLVVDHCHLTGKIRGILCKKCNCALGYLGDTVEGIRKVIDYLVL